MLSLLLASFWKVTVSKFTIIEPKTGPQFPTNIQYFLGNIGLTPYGSTLEANLLLPSPSNLCQVATLPTHHFEGRIVLAWRGDCTFTDKLLNAESKGAAMLIVIDNIEQERSIIMRDTGKGRYASIPCIFVKEHTGEALIDLVQNNKHVRAIIEFQEVRKDISEVDLILTSADRHSYIVIRELAPYLRRVWPQIKLYLHYYSFICQHCLESDCLSGQQVCLMDFSNNNYQDGQRLILQQLRQLTIFNLTGEKYFDYMEMYDNHCNVNFMEDCALNVLKFLEMPAQQIELQVQKYVEDGGEVLTVDRQYIQHSGVTEVPWALVNGQKYYGILDGHGIFLMICGSLKNPPKVCKEGLVDHREATTTQVLILISFIVLCIAIAMLSFYLCMKQCGGRQLAEQIRGGVSRTVGRMIKLGRKERVEPQHEELVEQIESQRL